MNPIKLSHLLWTNAFLLTFLFCHFHQENLKPEKIITIDHQEAEILSLSRRSFRTWMVVELKDIPGIFGVSLFKKTPLLHAGDTLSLTGTIERPQKRSSLSGFINLNETPKLIQKNSSSLRLKFQSHYRKLCQEFLTPQATRAMPALFLGDRASLSGPLYKHFQLTGTLHYLALSGLHLGLILIPWLILARLLRFSLKQQALIGLVITLSYLALTGPLPSLVRAALSFAFLVVARLINRSVNQWNVLSAVAILCLLIQPQQVHSLGFFMTFSALWGLLFLEPQLNKLFPIFQKHTLGNLFRFNFAAWLGIAPVLLLFFGEIYPGAIVLNLILMPLITLLLFLAMIFPLIPSLTSLPINYLWDIIDWILTWSLKNLEKPWGPSFPEVTSLLFLGGCFLLWSLPKKKSYLIFSYFIFSAVTLKFLDSPYPFTQERAKQFNVGQGSCALVETAKGRGMLVDCGGSRLDVGRRILTPELRARGIKEISALFLTHLDWDHVSGLEDILARFPTGFIGLNSKQAEQPALKNIQKLAKLYGVEIKELSRGQNFRLDNCHLSIEHPSPSSPGPENERSLVIRLTGPKKTILFLGDLDETGTKDYLLYTQPQKTDIFTAPHHGSRNRFTPLLLEVLQPQEIWLSARPSFPQEPSILNFPNLKVSWKEEGESGL